MAWKNRAGNRLAVDLLAPPASARVLDIGCVPGGRFVALLRLSDATAGAARRTAHGYTPPPPP
jgi:hypothetical protein